MKQFRWMVVLAGLSFASVTTAQDMTDNVYYKLYQTRVELKEIAVKKQEASYKYEVAKFKRYQKLHRRHAISDQDFEQYEKAVELSRLTLEDLKASVFEAQAMLDIARERINLGLDMPICPSTLQ